MCSLNWIILLLSLYATNVISALQVFPRLVNVQDFGDYLIQSGKSYTNSREYQFRESVFKSKKSIVDQGNQNAALGHCPFYMAINPLADLTQTEVARITGSKISFLGEGLTSRHENLVEADANEDKFPESFDWREKGGVTPAKFQGFDCGSCWSFATIGALEGHLFRRTGVLVPLSEQNLVDCSEQYGSEGCDGGFQEYAFEYIRDHGVTIASKYPYTQIQNEQCLVNATASLIRIRDYTRIKPGDESKMKQIIATMGPLACSMNGSPVTFEQYGGGIYNDNECNKDEVNHSVVVVGYGSENGHDYWIIKNSYSSNWGENGFMRLLRNQNSFCGIASECSYPVL